MTMNKAQSQTLRRSIPAKTVGMCTVLICLPIQDCFEIMFFSMTAFQYCVYF